MLRPHLVAACLVLSCLAAAPVRAQELGLGPPPSRPFLAGDGAFAAKVPSSWAASDFPKTHTVQFSIPGPGAAWLQVQRLQVPAGARPKQLLLRARESRLAKLPHFREFGRQELLVNGLRAATLSGDFWFQGNAEYPRAVEELFIVDGSEAFELHFECFEPMVGAMRADINAFYMSFVAHPGARGAPQSPTQETDGLQEMMDRVPF